MTKKLTCTCESKFQDKLYGKGVRIHNSAINVGSKVEKYRCTVCGGER